GSPDEDGDRFIEIWNLVFMQYEQVTPDERVNLPRPSIDTGMGLERIAAVMQGKHDNYDIDTMRRIIEASAEAAGVDPDGAFKVSHRVVADHLRASTFLIADGVLPSNEGRGYVLRRIMRRAMRHAHIMGCTDPLLHRLVPTLVREMGEAFPEIARAQSLATETLKLEETRFKETLDRGLRILSDETGKLASGQALDGEVAFKLYDTYGFPVDLTADILRGQGRALDQAGFDTAMERQRAAARRSWSGSGEAATDRTWFEVRDAVGATEFLGYDTTSAEGVVTALVVDGKRVDTASPGDEVLVIVNQTPFYGESGGQMGDTGTLRSAGGAALSVTDTQKKLGDVFIHVGTLAGGPLKIGDPVEMAVDAERRDRLRANHSATHLLHEALRRRLGDHVAQKGSLVAPERLRFDFSQPTAIAREDLAWVEAEVNRRVRMNSRVTTRLMTPDAAIGEGAMALFGEKYGDEVRVVSMGGDVEADGKSAWSVELCGGTHVRRTGDIGLVKVVSEAAVAAGVRRVEAVTGIGALDWLNARETALAEASAELKTTPEDLPGRVHALMEERRRLERELVETRKKLASGSGGGGVTKTVSGIAYAARSLDGVPARELKGVADGLKQEIGSGVVAVVSNDDGKASLVVGVTADLISRISAVDLVRVGSEALGGKGGGGRPDMAQAGGPDGSAGETALAAIEAALASSPGAA
ncbi:MAG: alanine--tRNA ligase, partial [Thalassobaculaceae bacterium]|nr:alanine--tRNA ligase [Thalassobaculaceae bacterium]